MTTQSKRLEEIEAFLHDRFAQCIRECGAVNIDDYERAKPYVQDCMRYFTWEVGR